MDDLLRGVARTVERYGMLPPGDSPVIAAVSGGPDSMALLECLAQLLGAEAAKRIIVAHFDHRIRPESAGDAEFVRQVSERRGCEFASESEDVPLIAAREGLGIEEAARNSRYAFLSRLAERRGARVVALGHNADDNVETVLLNLIRGAGVRGMGGIPPVRPLGRTRIVRPLIETGRAEIETFLRSRGIAYLEDSTNRDDAYRRNFVRMNVTPLLRRLQPALGEVVARATRTFRETDVWLEDEARRRLGADPLTAGIWRDSPEAVRPYLLRGAAARAGLKGLSAIHADLVGELLAGDEGGEVDLPGGALARVRDGALEFAEGREAEQAAEPWAVRLKTPGEVTLPDGRLILARVFERAPGAEPPRLTDISAPEWLDFDRLGRPAELLVRSRRPGDAIRLLGGGTKSLKRLFIDLKIPLSERDAVPVVVGEETLWIAPYRACETGRVDSATISVLELALLKSAP